MTRYVLHSVGILIILSGYILLHTYSVTRYVLMLTGYILLQTLHLRPYKVCIPTFL